jgi:hypothetical protein
MPLVINLSIYIYIYIYRPTYPSVLKRIEFTHRFSKIKSRFGIYSCDSQKMMKKVRELLVFFNFGGVESFMKIARSLRFLK